MEIILFEDEKQSEFLPLTYTRPVGELRIGILKIAEKWAKVLDAQVTHETRDYLCEIYPPSQSEGAVFINARLVPDAGLINVIRNLKPGESLIKEGTLLAKIGNGKNQIEHPYGILLLNSVTDLFSKNGEALKRDFELLSTGRKSAAIDKSNTLIGKKEMVFIEEGAQVYASVLNTMEGPIYIAKDALVMEGSLVRGPFCLGEHSQLKMGAKIYGPTTIGPHCKIGGEVTNSIVQGYSNKGHDGFIGNTIIGEWCNLGADTNTSNLKNNYSSVRVWNYTSNQYADTGLTFCGLIMADHSKCSINTMFNTGTVVGVSVNVFGGGFPPKHNPSFTWGGASGSTEYDLEKAIQTAEKVMARRNMQLTAKDRKLLTHIFKLTQPDRASATQSQD